MANEKRLIDANDVYSLFDVKGMARLHVADIDVIPRVDAVEVVRCKDCKHYVPERKHPWNEETGYDFTKVEILQFGECRGQNAIFTEDGSVNVHENDFCSNGERKDNV